MKINSKKIVYIISSTIIFLLSSIWLVLVEEERIGVYVGVLSIIILSLGYITNPKNKYWFILDCIAIGCILYFIILDILRYLSSYSI
jgi:hypothetical protein